MRRGWKIDILCIRYVIYDFKCLQIHFVAVDLQIEYLHIVSLDGDTWDLNEWTEKIKSRPHERRWGHKVQCANLQYSPSWLLHHSLQTAHVHFFMDLHSDDHSCTDILLSFVLIVFALLKISVFFLFFYFLAALTWLSCTLDSFETLWRSNWHTNKKKKPANPIRMFLSMILFQCKLEELQWRVSGCKLPQMCLFAGSRWTPSLFL